MYIWLMHTQTHTYIYIYIYIYYFFVLVSSQREVLHAEDLLRMSNVHLLRGFIELGKLLEKEKDIKNIMSSPDIYQT